MTGIVLAVALAAGGEMKSDGGVEQAGFWPGGGTAWSGTTSYYGFGREVPYGYGFGPEVYGPRLGTATNKDRYGPAGYDRPDLGYDYNSRRRIFLFQRWRR